MPTRRAPSARKDAVPELLQAWNDGDDRALRTLMPLLFAELYRIAERLFARRRTDPMWQPGVLVNELYLRFEQKRRVDWRDTEHFLAIAATEMRRILLIDARRQGAAKRGCGYADVALSKDIEVADEGWMTDVDVLALEAALGRLRTIDAEAGRIIEQRFFFGLSVPEVARALGVTERTIYRRWAFAKTWLYDQLSEAA